MPVQSASSSTRRTRAPGLLAALAASLLAGACSSSSEIGSLDSFLSPASQTSNGADTGGSAAPKTELDKAIAYWGDEMKRKPQDLKTTLAYARNLKAAGHKQQAFEVLQGASVIHGDNKELAAEMGRLALDFDNVGAAEKLLAMADDPLKPDWKLISARGTVMAKQSKYADAIPFFERALSVSPNQPSVMNNLAMAHAASGDPAKAEELLRKAAGSSKDPKIRQNLALVLGLQGKHEEAGSIRAVAAPSATAAAADTEYVKMMVKATPATTPVAATPAVATQRAAPPVVSPAARTIQAKAPAKPAAASTTAMRPAGAPGDVAAPAGSWSTTVQAAR